MINFHERMKQYKVSEIPKHLLAEWVKQNRKAMSDLIVKTTVAKIHAEPGISAQDAIDFGLECGAAYFKRSMEEIKEYSNGKET